MANYRVIKEGILHKIERLDYPRFEASRNTSRPIPIIQKLTFHDECSAQEIAEVVNEMSEYILTIQNTD